MLKKLLNVCRKNYLTGNAMLSLVDIVEINSLGDGVSEDAMVYWQARRIV